MTHNIIQAIKNMLGYSHVTITEHLNGFHNPQLFALYHPQHFAYLKDVISDGQYLYALFREENKSLYIRRYDLPCPTQETWETAFELFKQGEFGNRVLTFHENWEIQIPLEYCYRLHMDFHNKLVQIIPSGLDDFEKEKLCTEQRGWKIRFVHIENAKGYDYENFCENWAKNSSEYHDMINDEDLKAKNAYFFGKDVNTTFIPETFVNSEHMNEMVENFKVNELDKAQAIYGTPLQNKGLNLYFETTFSIFTNKIEKNYSEYGLYMKLARELPITIRKFNLLYQPRTIDSVKEHNILLL